MSTEGVTLNPGRKNGERANAELTYPLNPATALYLNSDLDYPGSEYVTLGRVSILIKNADRDGQWIVKATVIEVSPIDDYYLRVGQVVWIRQRTLNALRRERSVPKKTAGHTSVLGEPIAKPQDNPQHDDYIQVGLGGDFEKTPNITGNGKYYDEGF